MAANRLGADSGAVDISIDVAARMRSKGVSVVNMTTTAVERVWAILDGLSFQLGEFIDLVWPVDTGASQADWETTAEGFEWVIRNPREYAEFVHRKGTPDSDRVYKQIAERSEELLRGALPQIQSIAKAGQKDDTPARPSLIQQFLLPSIVGPSEAGRGTIFAARAAGFLRENTRSRERARARAR